MQNNVPYQKYINNNYFDVIETVKNSAYGSKMFSKTLVKGKGQVAIVEKSLEKNIKDKRILYYGLALLF